MRRKLSVIAAVLALGVSGVAAGSAAAAENAVLTHQTWSFAGPFGTFDQRSLQRGYKVYREVCSTCHTMNLLSFRNLGEKYGPFYDEKYPNPNDNPYVKSLASSITTIPDINPDTGDAIQRPGVTADHFPDPFPNEIAAKASTGGAIPPDLSVIIKAREGGADYVYSLLKGFDAPPAGLIVPSNLNYNKSYPGDLSSAWHGPKGSHLPPGGLIGMKKPLDDCKVTFDDGTGCTVDQEAKDVVTFLAWASEPKQTERKRLGMWVMIYLVFMAGLAYASYRKVWKNESHG